MGWARLVGRVWVMECKGKRGRGRPRWMFSKQEAEDLARGVSMGMTKNGAYLSRNPSWESEYQKEEKI